MTVQVVVMGVAGCGKTTIAEAVRDRMGYVYAEGDEFHPKASVEKMRAGIPLTDEDRWPWLATINRWMREQAAEGNSTVVSCSALKRAYRDVLRRDIPVFFVHMVGSEEVIGKRMAARKGHYMPPSLLPSQFADLEPLEDDEPGITVSIEGDVDEMVARALEAVREHAAKEERALAA
ncbi:gluconokinase [Bifidobacterium sp. 82T24]|uniref:gluconokinase n=1 Tax=Bifidobacterium pluvialisilvae TaxID=2834436 RepID=UPI001C583463|nr:gluconokinase [Bifidobacterium pluvialisilvae]MBW3088506.1 gluconokinase [Bifidobacterium pluvialisilvae]